MREEKTVRKPTKVQKTALKILLDESGFWSHDERVPAAVLQILVSKEWAVWRRRKDEERAKIYLFYTLTQVGVNAALG